MKKFKGTPGPWFEHREGFSTVYIEARIGGGIIQEVAACGPCDKGSEQQSANANLIAAAPELLEALRQLRDYLQDVYGIDEDECDAEHPFMLANSAINKALGE